MFRVCAVMTILLAGTGAWAYSTHPEISVSRAFSAQSATSGQTITVTLTVEVGSLLDSLRGFYLSDPVPLGLQPTAGSVQLNGVDIQAIRESSGAVVPGCTLERWVLETPPDFVENLPVSSPSTLVVTYDVTIPSGAGSGPVGFPGYSWVGMIASHQDAGDNFGFEDSPAVITVQAAYLLFDDFEDGDDSENPRWTHWTGTWAVESGEYHQSQGMDNAFSVAGDAAWTDYRVETKVKLSDPGGGGTGPMFRVTDTDNYYLFEVTAGSASADIWRRAGGSWQNLASGTAPAALTAGTWYTLAVLVEGDSIQAWVGDDLVIETTDSTLPAGRIGLNAGEEAWFDDVKVSEPGAQPNQPPTATAGAEPSSGDAPLEVQFSGQAQDPDGSIQAWAWDFGDGESSSDQNPVHTYQTPGTRVARLTATDDRGATGTDTVTILVFEPSDGGSGDEVAGGCGCLNGGSGAVSRLAILMLLGLWLRRRSV